MRGKHPLCTLAGNIMRITPADAGKTAAVANQTTTARDHPRGCGENTAIAASMPINIGSPPRMRGKPINWLSVAVSYRITPADAGKTRAKRTKTMPPQDHPRGCGENAPARSSSSPTQGSPPRMRGKPFAPRRYHYRVGITPADAGKTLLFCLRSRRRWDHPRGCGENVQTSLFRPARRGSPPRMRGKHVAAAQVKPRRRITPAGAGKTRTLRPSRPKSGDHPRRCGENCVR